MIHNGDAGRGIIGVVDLTDLMVQIPFLCFQFVSVCVFLELIFGLLSCRDEY